MTTYKRKGFDFCTYPGCLSQEYAGDVDGWRYCPEHVDEGNPDLDLNPPPAYVPVDGEEFISAETVLKVQDFDGGV